jgi:exodeoxyribonuclease VII small subunit
VTRKKAKPVKADKVPFEEAIAKLESIVGQLEEGDLPLEKSLELFEEGVKLTRGCVQRLDAAERRIEILLGEGDSTEPFEPPEED